MVMAAVRVMVRMILRHGVAPSVARGGKLVEDRAVRPLVAMAAVDEAGDRGLHTSLRSSAKPFQALPLVRAREDLDDADIAIASASHRAEPEQIEAVRRLLAKAPATEQDLEVGVQEGRPPEPISHNCSGKHAGMLAACRSRGWPTAGYRLAGHPLQDEILAEVATAAVIMERITVAAAATVAAAENPKGMVAREERRAAVATAVNPRSAADAKVAVKATGDVAGKTSATKAIARAGMAVMVARAQNAATVKV